MCFMRGPSHTTIGGEPADEAEKAGIRGFCPKSEAECIIEAVEMLHCAAKNIFRRPCTEQLPLISFH